MSRRPITRIHAALVLQDVMGDVALHRLGLMDEWSLNVAFEKEPELDRKAVEAIVDEALEAARTCSREELCVRGKAFWERFFAP